MNICLRILLTLLLAVSIALPGFGGDGGENGGGTGIWILPRACPVLGTTSIAPRDQRSFASLQSDIVIEVSQECGACGAISVDDVTGTPCCLPVVGSRVRISAAMLQTLSTSGAKATVVVMDAQGLGYTILVTASAAGAVVRVY